MMKILYIEDDSIDQRIMTRLSKKLDFEIIHSSDFNQVVNILSREPVDLIISDSRVESEYVVDHLSILENHSLIVLTNNKHQKGLHELEVYEKPISPELMNNILTKFKPKNAS